MLVFNKFNQVVSCFLNTSTPGVINSASFATNVNLNTGSSSTVIFADLNNDGRPDLVGLNGPFHVSQNTSTGGTLSFTPGIDFNDGTTYSSLAAGDIDGDGKPDLVMAGDSGIAVYQNQSLNGNILLSGKISILNGKNVSFIKLADVDGDGKLDLVVAYHNTSNSSGNVISVFRNISAGGTITAASFAAQIDFSIGSSVANLLVADIDGDGKPDIIINDNAVSVLLNNSTINNISFSSKANIYNGISPIAGFSTYLTVCDVDRDGKPDIIFNDGTNNSVYFIHNKPQAAVAAVTPPVINSFTPATALIGANVVIKGAALTVLLFRMLFTSAQRKPRWFPPPQRSLQYRRRKAVHTSRFQF